MLSKERSSQDRLTGQKAVISDARRRLVKGGMAAPVLMTLPRISSAQASNQMCVEPKTGGVAEAEGVGPGGLGNYVSVSRPAFKINIAGTDHIVVYGGYSYTDLASACGDAMEWHDVAAWGTTYIPQSCSGTGPGAFSDGVNTYAATAVGNYSVIVLVDETGAPVGVLGPTGGSTNIITTSCWASAMAGTPLPQ